MCNGLHKLCWNVYLCFSNLRWNIFIRPERIKDIYIFQVLRNILSCIFAQIEFILRNIQNFLDYKLHWKFRYILCINISLLYNHKEVRIAPCANGTLLPANSILNLSTLSMSNLSIFVKFMLKTPSGDDL